MHQSELLKNVTSFNLKIVSRETKTKPSTFLFTSSQIVKEQNLLKVDFQKIIRPITRTQDPAASSKPLSMKRVIDPLKKRVKHQNKLFQTFPG
jgi:hypothetical protein